MNQERKRRVLIQQILDSCSQLVWNLAVALCPTFNVRVRLLARILCVSNDAETEQWRRHTDDRVPNYLKFDMD